MIADAAAADAAAAAAAAADAAAAAPDLLRWLLDRDRDPQLTAVERFARAHERGTVAERYHNAIPLSAPGPGEQYAFEVDLDGCTGCKACVAACHNLNGLDPIETWRTVGVVHGGDDRAPYEQHVTAACHHCLDPACLSGCPVKAYEKDPITGIVRHLDDQCIGCQYCTLTCPYDVPRYSPSRGIVRKCDMCHQRLAVSEAPACVQACPNEAIRIRVVEQRRVVADNEAGRFLPGAPDPGITQPSTIYRTERPVPRNALPIDWYSARPERAHAPLAWMLVLTQLAVGAFVALALLPLSTDATLLPLQRGHAISAAAVGLLALGASLLHLGRPLLAHRVVLGLRRSWLSREVLAFGAFSAATVGYAAASWFGPAPGWLAATTAALGLVAVGCSIMVYVATRRDGWRGELVTAKFGFTTAGLGVATTLAAVAVGAAAAPELAALAHELARDLARALVVITALGLGWGVALLAHVRDRRHGALKRSAVLMLGPLRALTIARFVTGALGGIAAPALYLLVGDPAGGASLGGGAAIAVVGLLLALAGELVDRHLFFVAVAAPRMPGAAP